MQVGKYTKELDSALPGKYTKQIYDALIKKEAKILVQLRTGMVRLNRYLKAINAVESIDSDYCGNRETPKYFLFQCSQWRYLREQIREVAAGRWGDTSYFLGGKSCRNDDDEWKPNMKAIRATIKYARETGRLDVLIV